MKMEERNKRAEESESEGEIQDLYQEVILDHNKHPRNFGKPPAEKESKFKLQEGFNPLCGDHLFLHIQMDEAGEKILDLCFEGEGCAISKASTSMMTVAMKGKTREEAKVIFDEFHRLLCRKLDPQNESHHLGRLEVFSGIWKFPARVKCAGLAWHTLNAALVGNEKVVKTE
jgi:nitrogen fixation NifU-like protein